MQYLEERVEQRNEESPLSEKSLKSTLSSYPKIRETPREPVLTPPQKAFLSYFCFLNYSLYENKYIPQFNICWSFYPGKQEKI